MSLLSGKKLIVLGIIVVLLAAIPLVFWQVSQQQQTQSSAAPATILSFQPAVVTTTVGQKFDVDIYLDPGTNNVLSTNFTVTYDPTKLATTGAGFTPITHPDAATPGFPGTVEGPTYTANGIFINFSVGTNATKAIATKTKIATVSFMAKAATSTSTPISFSEPYASSIVGLDAGEDNVISSANPATVTINAAAIAATPTATPSATLAPTATPGPTTAAQAPVCTGLSVDRATTGPAPLSITFSAVGNHPGGTISKATFNFGDTQVQDVTQAGGIGTNSVNAQIAHTYNNPGTYTATAILTDSKGVTSTVGTCTQTITVTKAAAATGGTTTAPTIVAAAPTATPLPTSTPVPTRAPIEKPGPGNTLIGVGAVGAMLSIIGAVIFFIL